MPVPVHDAEPAPTADSVPMLSPRPVKAGVAAPAALSALAAVERPTAAKTAAPAAPRTAVTTVFPDTGSELIGIEEIGAKPGIVTPRQPPKG